MYPILIARQLRARGRDIVSVQESPGGGTPDEEVFRVAQLDGRFIVTENVRDYRPLADASLVAGDRHAGLVLTTERRWPRSDPGALIAALDRLLASKVEQPVDEEGSWACRFGRCRRS
jgi:hypothetical protein